MPDDWSAEEIAVATRAYMWMRRSYADGFKPVKVRVNEALVAGPLHKRDKLDYRFANISWVLQQMGLEPLQGFKPSSNVGPTNTALIQEEISKYIDGPKAYKRVSALVQALPPDIVNRAAEELANGVDFDYPDSTTYDVVMPNGDKIAPKKIIGYAGLLHYGAPLMPADFSGGVDSFAFGKLQTGGHAPVQKGEEDEDFEPLDEEEFKDAVNKAKKKGFKTPPKGAKNPPKKKVTSYAYKRDPRIVAFVETRANGICEQCENNAPFMRGKDDPYLEVHHIIPLSQGGADATENAAALCPNCHRECHYGENAMAIQKALLKKVKSMK